MKTHEAHLARVREYVAKKKRQGRRIRETRHDTNDNKLVQNLPIHAGPQERGNVILKEDTFVELGNPSVASCAFVIWSDDPSSITDGLITLIGDDIQQSEDKSLPFGQVIIVGGTKLAEENYLDLEKTQYTSNQIEGYMLRSVPRRVWSRVSREAAGKGFSFETLGQALMSIFRRKQPLIEATEVIFITSSKEDVNELDNIASDVRKFSGELKKWVRQEDGTYDCNEYSCATCDEKELCDTIRKWISLRRKKNAKALDKVH